MSGSGIARAREEKPEGAKAVQFSIDAKKRLVHTTFGKKVTAGDIEQYARHLRTDPAFEPMFSEIVDLRAAEDLDLGAEDFFRLADEIDPFSMNAKRAFIVCTPIQSHAARMHKILRTQRNIEMFRSCEEAEHWVNS
jgi:hypothetical protein